MPILRMQIIYLGTLVCHVLISPVKSPQCREAESRVERGTLVASADAMRRRTGQARSLPGVSGSAMLAV